MDTPIQVFVIGRLGELVKKVVELEMLIEQDHRNEIAILELASYRQVLAAWPVEEPDTVKLLIQDFTEAIRKLAVADKDLDITVGSINPVRLGMDVSDYLRCRNEVKAKMKRLNSLGRYVGNVPLMNVRLT